ncbi:MAG: 4a-hydroxytetrahydrobiopterin dehydratase [Candidatus Paceibacterota bacterium]
MSCSGCHDEGVEKMDESEVRTRLLVLPKWITPNGFRIEKTFSFPDFKQALDFTNKVGDIAEKEGHHPDIFLSWGVVRISLTTHSVKGVTEHDFLLAEMIESLTL